MTPQEISTCANCLYFRLGADASLRRPVGICRRHAPQPSDDERDAWWPFVYVDDWCGEHKKVPR